MFCRSDDCPKAMSGKVVSENLSDVGAPGSDNTENGGMSDGLNGNPEKQAENKPRVKNEQEPDVGHQKER